MREIKFRAWDKVNKKWVDPSIVDLWGIFVLSNKESFTHEMSQWTGLHDKHGKEIYEGDVVKFLRKQGYWSHNRGDIATVYFIQDQQAQYCGFGFSALHPLTYNIAKKIEVIGNIYEGKESK